MHIRVLHGSTGPAVRARPGIGALLLAVTVGGCGDATAPLPTHAIEVLAGAGQSSVAGQTLTLPVSVRLVDSAGRPVEGGRLEVRASGDGRPSPSVLTTGPDGTGSVGWRLGPSPGPQELRFDHTTSSATTEVAATALSLDPVDALRVAGLGSGQRIGALIDGTTALGEADDFVFTASGGVLGVGDWRPASRSEMAVFVPGAAPAFVPDPAWTGGADTLRLPAPDPVPLSVTVWILQGPASTARVRLADDLLTASTLYEVEGLGIEFVDVEFVDTLTVDTTAAFMDFTCSRRPELQAAAGRRQGRINVYVVRRVDGSTSRGQACEIGGSFVALGHEAGSTLLAHEIGHNLALIHPPDDPSFFDATNIMHAASDIRAHLTEGQIFRAHLNERSALNVLHPPAAPEMLRSCFGGSSEACPPAELRLWSDGRYPAFPATAAAPAVLEACGTRGEPGLVADGRAATWRDRGSAWADAPPQELLESVAAAARARTAATRDFLDRRRDGAPRWIRHLRPGGPDPDAAASRAVAAVRALWRDNAARSR